MMELDPSQLAAVELACTASFGVITGGPGTGKSTSLRVALDRMDMAGQSYALAAPSGKAAKRMTEATGRPASTIHRLLGWTPFGWTYRADNPLEQSCIIIDESSMVDVELAADLLDAIAPHTRLILTGDANQLPPVGPGRMFGELVESNAVPVARLSTVHRSAAESWVCVNAPKVLAGVPIDLSPHHDFRFVEAESQEDVARAIALLVGQDEYRGAQVLAPQRNTECGVEALNTRLQARLNPPGGDRAEWKLGDKLLRCGDRVIQTANNYKLCSTDGLAGVFNGEVGDIVALEERLVVDFGDRRVAYSKGDAATGLDLAYALSVHKSQGSEFPYVIFAVHSAHTFMLSRPLFYTAITRAKKGVILVGNQKGLSVACSAKEPPKRQTALIERMREYEIAAAAAGGDNS